MPYPDKGRGVQAGSTARCGQPRSHSRTAVPAAVQAVVPVVCVAHAPQPRRVGVVVCIVARVAARAPSVAHARARACRPTTSLMHVPKDHTPSAGTHPGRPQGCVPCMVSPGRGGVSLHGNPEPTEPSHSMSTAAHRLWTQVTSSNEGARTRRASNAGRMFFAVSQGGVTGAAEQRWRGACARGRGAAGGRARARARACGRRSARPPSSESSPPLLLPPPLSSLLLPSDVLVTCVDKQPLHCLRHVKSHQEGIPRQCDPQMLTP